jgi:endonuclease/exonuclease/phosphatase family metal-dependent hydrolase
MVLGDFNEWAPGLATRLLRSHLSSVDIRTHLRRRRTYPGMVPVLHLDHIYYDDPLDLEALLLHRTRLALMASDHLPLLADFHLPAR